jgi:hypothetical protein
MNRTSSKNDTVAPPGAMRPARWAERHDLSRSQVYKMIAAGEVIARKCGARTLIFDEDNANWRHSLPKVPAEKSAA